MVRFFDEDFYLRNNPDVAASVQAGTFTAEEHFEQYGRFEGRNPNAFVDLDFYLQQNPDVAEAVANGSTTAYDHFVTYGAQEQRQPSPLFDPAFYLEQNPDVDSAVTAGTLTPFAHFFDYGQGNGELRAPAPGIDLQAYAQANPDVLAQAEAGQIGIAEHLFTYGFAEGRDLGNGLNLADFANDPDFQAAVASGNAAAALARVNEVAPFLPAFTPPEGWTPAADASIPVDFIPTEGVRLQIPQGVEVPDDIELPDTFEQPGSSETPDESGSGGGTPSTPTFSVTESGTSPNITLTFAGSATGDITVTENAGALTFTRDGHEASTKPDLTDLDDAGIPGPLTMSAATFAVTGLAAKLAAGATKVDASGATAAQLTALSSNAAKLAADGLSNLTLTNTQSTTEIGNLLGKATDAQVTATNMDGTDLAAVSTNIAKVVTDGITGTLALSTTGLDETDIGNLLGTQTATAATVNVDAASMTDAELGAVNTGIVKVDAISNLTLTDTQSAAAIGNLLGKATDAQVTATNMDGTDLAAVSTNIGNVANNGITGTLALSTTGLDETAISNLLGAKTADAATVNVNTASDSDSDSDSDSGMTSAELTAVAQGLAKINALTIDTTHQIQGQGQAADISGRSFSLTGTNTTTDYLQLGTTSGDDTITLTNVTTTDASVVVDASTGTDTIAFGTGTFSVLFDHTADGTGGNSITGFDVGDGGDVLAFKDNANLDLSGTASETFDKGDISNADQVTGNVIVATNAITAASDIETMLANQSGVTGGAVVVAYNTNTTQTELYFDSDGANDGSGAEVTLLGVVDITQADVANLTAYNFHVI
ncbi:calcium-binding protein [Marichromatium purpuratum 984]|uniref:Calcium-binding protein n=2 Tax=Marichromatium purpuratum TaxID=37487 RepID=W0E0E0_MARPU|nr:calcium-binding protein [Marichromatium purpuratum 984]